MRCFGELVLPKLLTKQDSVVICLVVISQVLDVCKVFRTNHFCQLVMHKPNVPSNATLIRALLSTQNASWRPVSNVNVFA